MSAHVLYPDTDKAENLVFKPPRKLNTGALRVDLKYKRGANEIDILYQTPRVSRVFAKNWAPVPKDEKEKTKPNWKISLSLSGHAIPGTESHDFYEGWNDIEATAVKTAASHSVEWFKASDALRERHRDTDRD